MMRCSALVMGLCLAGAVPAGAANHEITIANMRFGAAPKQLRIGDTVTWKNMDFLRHTATARNGAFDLKLAPGAQATITLQTTGHLAVFCRYHPGMTLVLNVIR